MFNKKDADRETKSGGKKFYGYDDKETGKTDWYDENGQLDSTTKTPSDDGDDW